MIFLNVTYTQILIIIQLYTYLFENTIIFQVLSLFLLISQLSITHCKRYNKKEKFLIVVDDDQQTGANKFNNYNQQYFKHQSYLFNKIPDPNNLLKFEPSDARYYFWKHKLTTSTEAPTTTEMPETTTEMMTTTEVPTTTEMPTETVPSVDYDLSNIPSNYPELLMYYKLCPVNITGKYNPKDIPLPQPIPPPPATSSFNYLSQNQQKIKPSDISNQFPLEGTLNADPYTNNYISIYGSHLPNSLNAQNSYFGDQTYANQYSIGYKRPSTLTTVGNGVQYGPLGEIAGYQQQNYGAESSKFIPGYLQNNAQHSGNQQATIYLPPTFTSSGNPSSDEQNMEHSMKDFYQKMGLQVIDLTMTNKNFQDANGIRINRQLGIVSNSKLSPEFGSAASKLIRIPALQTSNRIPQIYNQFNPNTLNSYGYTNLNKNLLYFGPNKLNKITPVGTKIDFVNNQRPSLI